LGLTSLLLLRAPQGGASFDLWKFVSVGASAYDILPSGQQTVFSKVVGKSGSTGNSSHGRVFETSQQTTGSAAIAKDNGYSAWIAFRQWLLRDTNRAESVWFRQTEIDPNSAQR
jgi:hypothetical protein